LLAVILQNLLEVKINLRRLDQMPTVPELEVLVGEINTNVLSVGGKVTDAKNEVIATRSRIEGILADLRTQIANGVTIPQSVMDNLTAAKDGLAATGAEADIIKSTAAGLEPAPVV
jgi:hypothetical protein